MAEENQMGKGPAVSPQVEENAERGVRRARETAADIGSAARAASEEYRGKADQVWDDAKDRVRMFREDADQYVRKNPTRAVLTALGAGFVLGLIMRR
jgi:ElaB/YqjD/DUF883 family membrane-anchored ribosome-binding protein